MPRGSSLPGKVFCVFCSHRLGVGRAGLWGTPVPLQGSRDLAVVQCEGPAQCGSPPHICPLYLQLKARSIIVNLVT